LSIAAGVAIQKKTKKLFRKGEGTVNKMGVGEKKKKTVFTPSSNDYVGGNPKIVKDVIRRKEKTCGWGFCQTNQSHHPISKNYPKRLGGEENNRGGDENLQDGIDSSLVKKHLRKNNNGRRKGGRNKRHDR